MADQSTRITTCPGLDEKRRDLVNAMDAEIARIQKQPLLNDTAQAYAKIAATAGLELSSTIHENRGDCGLANRFIEQARRLVGLLK